MNNHRSEKIYRPQANKSISLSDIVNLIGGELFGIEESSERSLNDLFDGLGTLSMAQKTEISFITSEKFLKDSESSHAGVLITKDAWRPKTRPYIVVDSVWDAVVKVMTAFYHPRPKPAAIHPTAVLGSDVQLGEEVSIGPYCVVGDRCIIGNKTVLDAHCIVEQDCVIGEATFFHPRVTLCGMVRIGSRVIIHSGAVIGSDGFKFEPTVHGLLKIPQVGAVIIEDDVEIGANTTIDRAFLYETRIKRGTKLDNLVQVAHNVTIGEYCVFAAQTGVAGSTQIGQQCMFGGQVGIADGIEIVDKVIIGAQSGVNNSITESGAYLGSPPVPMKEFGKIVAVQKRLPELRKRLVELEKKIAETTEKI